MKFILLVLLQIILFLPLSGQNNALHFDGIDDNVVFTPAGSPSFAIGDNFTIEVWVKAPATQIDLGGQTNVILFKGMPATSVPFSIRVGNGTGGTANGTAAVRRINDLGTEIQLKSTSPINDDAWHHVAFVKDGTNLRLYIDGDLEDTETDFGAGDTQDGNRMMFGSRFRQGAGFQDYFLGAIDEVRIWSDVRSAAEIQSNINNELTGSEDNLMRYYSFNQGVAGGDNTGISKVNNFEGPPVRHGNLNNFELMGETSNFIGSDFGLVPVPTLSQWGLFILALLFLIGGSLSLKTASKKILLPGNR